MTKENELKPVELDMVTLMRKAKEVVAAYPLYKKFIDGTPLENDMATIMATFAYAALCLQEETRTTPPVQSPARDVLTSPLEIEGGESPKGASTPVQALSPKQTIDRFYCIQGLRTGICCPYYSEVLSIAKRQSTTPPIHKFTAEELFGIYCDNQITFDKENEAFRRIWQRLAAYVNSKL